MRAGPSPCSSKAIMVPSFDLSVFTLVPFPPACLWTCAHTDDAGHQKSSVASAPGGSEQALEGLGHPPGRRGGVRAALQRNASAFRSPEVRDEAAEGVGALDLG